MIWNKKKRIRICTIKQLSPSSQYLSLSRLTVSTFLSVTSKTLLLRNQTIFHLKALILKSLNHEYYLGHDGDFILFQTLMRIDTSQGKNAYLCFFAEAVLIDHLYPFFAEFGRFFSTDVKSA